MQKYTIAGITGKTYNAQGTADVQRKVNRAVGDNAQSGYGQGLGWVKITAENGNFTVIHCFNLMPRWRAHNVKLAIAELERASK